MPRELIYNRSTDETGPQNHAEVGWCRHRDDDRHHVQVGILGPEDSRSDARYVSLDRDGINRLIRALRKARDQAFGTDA